jgi:hypothetical protein
MLLSHKVLLAEARSYLAALADDAANLDAALEYERVLLELDWMHQREIPPITVVPTADRNVLYAVAQAAINHLVLHGVDPLEVALCQDMLTAAHDLDHHTVVDDVPHRHDVPDGRDVPGGHGGRGGSS